MYNLEKISSNLVLLSLISFGFFGSLSHLFNLFLLLLFIVYRLNSPSQKTVQFQSKILFFLLSGVFYILFLRGLYSEDLTDVMESLSPMIAVPLLAFLIILKEKDKFNFSAAQIARYSQISICFCLFVYLFSSLSFDYILIAEQDLEKKLDFLGLEQRISLFSGNPVPFSTVLSGLSILALTNWEYDNKIEKVFSFICFVLGAYCSIVLGGTRGSFFAMIICSPFIFWHLNRSRIFLFSCITILLFLSIVIYKMHTVGNLNIPVISRFIEGIVSVFSGENIDVSNWLRLSMWKASLIAISEAPLIGYGVSEHFNAIKFKLPETFIYSFSHPHNDIFSGFLSSGIIGGIFAISALLSPFWASVINKNQPPEVTFLGTTLTVTILATANLNTVLFNDITAGWLAFCTFIVWNLNESSNLKKNETQLF